MKVEFWGLMVIEVIQFPWPVRVYFLCIASTSVTLICRSSPPVINNWLLGENLRDLTAFPWSSNFPLNSSFLESNTWTTPSMFPQAERSPFYDYITWIIQSYITKTVNVPWIFIIFINFLSSRYVIADEGKSTREYFISIGVEVNLPKIKLLLIEDFFVESKTSFWVKVKDFEFGIYWRNSNPIP